MGLEINRVRDIVSKTRADLCKGQAESDSFEITREQEMIGTSSGGGRQ